MYGSIIIYETQIVTIIDPTTIGRIPWTNWSWITLLVSVLGAAGGLLVAATLKYADSILKTLAAAGGIVLTTILSYYFLNGPLNLVISIGATVVIISIANYTFDATTN
jgi:UDP-sugar transporter A1/2/3